MPQTSWHTMHRCPKLAQLEMQGATKRPAARPCHRILRWPKGWHHGWGTEVHGTEGDVSTKPPCTWCGESTGNLLCCFFPPTALPSGCYHDRRVFSRVRVTRAAGRKAGIERGTECYLVKVMKERNLRRAIKRKLTFL